MRTGKMKWSFWVSGIVSVFTFVFSFLNNLIWESLIRSFIIFIIFFFIVTIVQVVVQRVIGKTHLPDTETTGLGQHVNFVTPEETYMSPVEAGKDQQRRAQGDFSEFSPADFPRVARNEPSTLDPEEIAQALRVFSNE